MQINSTLTQQAMEPINGALSTSSVEQLSVDNAEQVGSAFCRAFYTAASEKRETLSKFYGHESKFHFDNQIVTGATEISKQYNTLLQNTHFKITCIKGLPTLHSQGVLIQVLGTLNLRPFSQVFILGQQGQKKYYVEVDHLQYIDDFLVTKGPEKAVPASNGHSNGSTVKAAPKPEQAEVKITPQKTQQTPKKAEEAPRHVKTETPKKEEAPKKPVALTAPQPVQPVVQQPKAPAPAPIQEQVPQEPPKPRTWANLVGGQGRQQPLPQAPFGQAQQMHPQQIQHMQQQQQAAAMHQHQQAMFQQHQRTQHVAQQQQSSDNLHQGDEGSNVMERKIYLGGITREIVPSNTAQAETEIKQVFYKYGEVESVHMPRKVLDSPNDTSKHAFAFITMRTKQGVQAIFGAATRDDAGAWKLPLKLDAFGFDGQAQISEQRDQPGGGFRGGRGGGNFGNRGGPFFRRGGPGGPQRGGMRQNFPGGQH